MAKAPPFCLACSPRPPWLKAPPIVPLRCPQVQLFHNNGVPIESWQYTQIQKWSLRASVPKPRSKAYPQLLALTVRALTQPSHSPHTALTQPWFDPSTHTHAMPACCCHSDFLELLRRCSRLSTTRLTITLTAAIVCRRVCPPDQAFGQGDQDEAAGIPVRGRRGASSPRDPRSTHAGPGVSCVSGRAMLTLSLRVRSRSARRCSSTPRTSQRRSARPARRRRPSAPPGDGGSTIAHTAGELTARHLLWALC